MEAFNRLITKARYCHHQTYLIISALSNQQSWNFQQHWHFPCIMYVDAFQRQIGIRERVKIIRQRAQKPIEDFIGKHISACSSWLQVRETQLQALIIESTQLLAQVKEQSCTGVKYSKIIATVHSAVRHWRRGGGRTRRAPITPPPYHPHTPTDAPSFPTITTILPFIALHFLSLK